MTDCFGVKGDPQRAVEVGQRALALAGTLEDTALQVVTHLFLGRAWPSQGYGSESTSASRGSPR
jgi:hypothetical protein